MVFTTPAIGALRRRFPGARITYLVEAAAEPVVRHHPAIDEIIVAERPRGFARWRYDLRLARRIRAARFDLVIDFHGGPRSRLLTWASGAPQRIGYGLPGRSWGYTVRVPWTRSLVPPRHSVANQWDLITPLGIAAPDRTADPVVMPVDAPSAASVDARLAAAGVPATAPLVVVHVSAGNPFRRWPESSFVALVTSLVRRDPSRRVIITSGPSDADAAGSVAAEARRQLGVHASAIPETGEFDLAELHALTARAAVYIGGDSGPAHVAATTRTPIVELLGPTLAGRSRPWRDPQWYAETVDAGELPCRPCSQRQCAPGDFRCLTRITPEQVAAAAERALHHGKMLQREKERHA